MGHPWKSRLCLYVQVILSIEQGYKRKETLQNVN